MADSDNQIIKTRSSGRARKAPVTFTPSKNSGNLASYTINRKKAIQKKIDASERTNDLHIAEKNGTLVLTFSAAAYEIFRHELQVFLEDKSDLIVEHTPKYSTDRSIVEDSYGIYELPTHKLPSYDDATKLPTYEEAEMTKHAEAMLESVERQEEAYENHAWKVTTLGTDGMFLCAFVMAFFFNWIGFLFSVCMFNTIAGRCGALSGLGLSIVKWIIIVKHNSWGSGWADEDSWIWWLLMLCGLLIFLRGAIHYAKTKYEWSQLENNLRSRHFFLF
ncbi:hypothetical protein FSP39_009501 [Pinctada imbricata]|uniref:Uncharacterized protein n=1 Tax=Pinctada imbricata TaxID=66713 RepID=A0AA88Y822_PINIB|nr:hypothetical protein FSP39_009501 [Pinctada imbricata]